MKQNDAKIINIKQKSNKLTLEHSINTSKYEFDDNILYESWTNGTLAENKIYQLRQLSPEFGYTKEIDYGLIAKLKNSLWMITGAVITFFSDYHQSIPLLAPTFFVVGLSILIYVLVNIRPKSWTNIHNDYGDVEIKISRDQCSEKERKKFEKSLKNAIIIAKEEYYY